MIEIKVLGPGCANCKRLYAEAERAIAETAVEATITKVVDFKEIMTYRIMATPALVIDGQVKASGRVPAAAEIAGWLLATPVQ